MWTVILFTCSINLTDCDMRRLPIAFKSEEWCEDIVSNYITIQEMLDDKDYTFRCVKKD